MRGQFIGIVLHCKSFVYVSKAFFILELDTNSGVDKIVAMRFTTAFGVDLCEDESSTASDKALTRYLTAVDGTRYSIGARCLGDVSYAKEELVIIGKVRVDASPLKTCCLLAQHNRIKISSLLCQNIMFPIVYYTFRIF